MNIAQIPEDIHGLVVPDQGVHHATSALGLAFQLLHMLDDLIGIGATIRQVA